MVRDRYSLSMTLAAVLAVLAVFVQSEDSIGESSLESNEHKDEQSEDTASFDAEGLFANRVLPVLRTKCFACHGDTPDDLKGGLDLSSRAAMLRGGDSEEPSLVEGKADRSPLYLATLRTHDAWSAMPPKENDSLTESQITDLKTWIDAGGPWPNDERMTELLKDSVKWNAVDGVRVPTSGGLSKEWTDRRYDPKNLWAYQPLWTDPEGILGDEGATSNNGEKRKSPIDILIDRRLDELQLSPAGPADRRTLIRRVTFDLTGLPPTPSEVNAFLRDSASDQIAFAKVVDRLLDSPAYGEQWGRHWLDVTRYADSSGFANDFERGNAWRYRDYVVRAFNDDKPYDQFIREQIAGDELYGDDSLGKEDRAKQIEGMIAVGFLRMGPWELTGMEVAKVARQRFLDDVTDSVGQVFLGHMMQCARCHDHKFDPIPTRDYYAMQAVFATTQLVDRSAPFLPNENLNGFEERKYLEQRREFCQQQIREVQAKETLDAARQWYLDHNQSSDEFEQALAEIMKKRKVVEAKVSFQQVRSLLQEKKIDPSRIPPRHVGFEPSDFGLERVARKGIERLKWRLERYEPYAFSVYSGSTPRKGSMTSPVRMPSNPMKNGDIEQTCILTGGDPFARGEPVKPSPLSAVAYFSEGSTQQSASSLEDSEWSDNIAGRRRDLADWIASSENRLTARVMVNRIWQWHFGKAIAGTPNNFGSTGKKPSHPELLDWLAGTFVQNQWSVKQMHRVILNSRVYQRSSQHPDAASLAEKDPLNESYAHFLPRRLEAEELRDAMLAASGELNREVGGIPIRPEMNLEAALQPRQVMGSFAESWQPSPLPSQRHRRSLYALRIRGLRDPFLEVFNAPSPDLSCEAREASTVTPQVFSLFNSEATFDRALAMANELQLHLLNRGNPENAVPYSPEVTYNLTQKQRETVITKGFERLLSRPPSSEELKFCIEHWQKMCERHQTLQFDPPNYPTEVTRIAVEENTGEKFSFTEPLEVYTDFVPDLKPHAASAELRGMAEVFMVLMNSNEFAYIY